MKRKQTIGEFLFNIFNNTLLAILALVCIYPFIYVISASLSSVDAVNSGQVVLWPKGVTLTAFRMVFKEKQLWVGYANSILYTSVGTVISLLLVIFGAYPLSKKRLHGRTLISLLLAFTMWFDPGIIPRFLNMQQLGLYNSRIGYMLMWAVTAFLVFLLRTYFQSIPDSLEEATKIDGGNDWQILWHIYFPLAKPAVIYVALTHAVSTWNAWFWAMLLFRDTEKVPMQLWLRKVIVDVQKISETIDNLPIGVSVETIIYATIVIALIPILIVYPILYKHFSKGAMIGSIKG